MDTTQAVLDRLDQVMAKAVHDATASKEASTEAMFRAMSNMQETLQTILTTCGPSVDQSAVVQYAANVLKTQHVQNAAVVSAATAAAANRQRLADVLERARSVTYCSALSAGWIEPTPQISGGGPGPSMTEMNLSSIVRIQSYFSVFSMNTPHTPGGIHQSTGTGFVLAIVPVGRDPVAQADGSYTLHVMTAAHVVEGSRLRSIRIPMHGMEEFRAEVVAFLPKYDIAMITAVVPAAICTRFVGKLSLASDEELAGLDRGARVQAYGFPNGLEQPKASEGIFNGLERHELMHDASTSPGSSGGPLVAMGINKVIGIVSWKVVAQAVEGVQFTMPVSLWHAAQGSIGNAMASGNPVVVPPLFGFCVQQTDELTFLAARRDCKEVAGGSRVCRVIKGTPADKAGMVVGDIIVAFDGMRIDRFSQTADARWSPSQKVSLFEIMFRVADFSAHEVVILHDGIVKTLRLVPVERVNTLRPMYEPWTRPRWLVIDGIVLMDSNKHLASVHAGLRKMDASNFFTETYVAVTNVVRGTPAASVQVIRWGNIITHVAGQRVSKVRDIARIVSSEGSDTAPIQFVTKGGKAYTTTRKQIADTARFMLHNGSKSLTNLAGPINFFPEAAVGSDGPSEEPRVRFDVQAVRG